MSKFTKAIRDELKASKDAEVVWKQRPEILLHSNIPKPLHGTVPRDILGREWWDATRAASYASTNYHCITCGIAKSKARSRQWLEGHEVYDINFHLGWMRYIETVPLCHYCHNYIHSGRLRMLLDRGEVHQAKYAAIIQHGDALLLQFGLKKPDPPSFIAPWGDWRLILHGREYPPIHRDEQEWRRAMGY